MTLPDTLATGAEESPGISHAGIALQALDTGRVLMLQRAQEEGDPNAGLWEFPGGSLENGEDPLAGAQREFAEEVGVAVPEDAEDGGTSWDLPPDAPKYRLHLLTVPTEKSINLYADDVPNPDDLQGVARESVAFWDPAHIQGDHIRPEVLESMKTIGETLSKAVTAAAIEDTAEALDVDDDDVMDAEDSLTQAIDLIEQVEDALADPGHDPAAVRELVTAAKSILAPAPTPDVTDADVLVASAAPVAPPDEWFEPFDLDGPTPLTVTADGRVFGHLATWDSCHRSGQYGNKCTRPPSDPTAPYFQLGEVLTASGAVVRVGTVTVGGGHADPRLGLVAAIEHYDDVSAQAAAVVVREDEYGIGLFGSVVPDAQPSLVAALRRSPLSGDWRKEKGKWRLVKAHAVNSPGFPIVRGLVASGGDPEEATAFFTTGRVPPKEPLVDLSAAARRLAKSAGLDMDSLVASARAAMADLDCGCDEEESLTASLVGDMDLPIAAYDIEWDGGAAADRVFKHFTEGDTVDVKGVQRAFLWKTEGEPADQKQGYDLPIADIIDGELKIVPRAVQAVAGGHGVGQLDGISAEDKSAIKSRIGTLYARVKEAHPEAPDNPFDKENA